MRAIWGGSRAARAADNSCFQPPNLRMVRLRGSRNSHSPRVPIGAGASGAKFEAESEMAGFFGARGLGAAAVILAGLTALPALAEDVPLPRPNRFRRRRC